MSDQVKACRVRQKGKGWKLKRTVQCAKCPWKKSTNPHDIPNGYRLEKHKNLVGTIAGEFDPFEPGILDKLAGGDLRVMGCHEEHDAECIGWLQNQRGPGNNIKLRIALINCLNADKIQTVGPQHEKFEDTVPKNEA